MLNYSKPATYNGYKQINVTDDLSTDALMPGSQWRGGYPFSATVKLERSKHDAQWRMYFTIYKSNGMGRETRETCVSVRNGLAAIKKECERILGGKARTLTPDAMWAALEPETCGI